MPDFIDNFSLGLSGLEDLVVSGIKKLSPLGAFVPDTHFAADTFAEQTAAEKAKAEHLSPEAEKAAREQLQAAARKLDAGNSVVKAAAKKTVNDVAQKAQDAGSSLWHLAAAAGVAFAVVVAWRLS